MSDRLPPLTALRAFEAAARRMSFSAAAEELAVTPAALSFQIKNLEEHLGAPLFVRLNRAVELTDAGQMLSSGAAPAFETLRQAWRSTRRLVESNRLSVTAGPSVTSKWLAPRLGAFARSHPDIELRFATTTALLDFARDGVDLAIRFGETEDHAALYSEKLLDEWVLPVMRPEIAARVAKPEDLMTETLIHDDSLSFLKTPPTWKRWFAEAGVDALSPKGPVFNQADHAIDVALQGLGVVLGRRSMAENALQSGALVAPFPLALTMRAQYRVVCPRGQENRPIVARFREWLQGEAAKDDDARSALELVMIE